MVRFILRAAFLLGLIAFFLPGGRNEDGPALNYFQAFAGIQEAVSDLGGFCDRAPTACGAAGQIAGFVVNRIGDGLEFGYRALAGTRGEAPAPAEPAAGTYPVPGADGPPAPSQGSVRSAAPLAIPYIPLAERHSSAGTPPADRGQARTEAAAAAASIPAPSPRPPSPGQLPAPR